MSITMMEMRMTSQRWCPIADAPRDGTEILIVCRDKVCIGEWLDFGKDQGRWLVNDDFREPSHWMFLPEAPDLEEA